MAEEPGEGGGGAPDPAFRGPGGSSGGIFEFAGGIGLFALGFYLVGSRVTISSYFPRWFGDHTFGITLIPFLIGVGFLFFDGRSIVGWVLSSLGLLAILAGVLTSLSLNFEPTSLFHTLIIFGCIAGGVGLMARAFRDHG